MAKCLVTKLKGSVDIKDPIYFRSIPLEIKNDNKDKGLRLFTIAGSNVKIVCPKGVTLTSSYTVVYNNKTYTNEYTLEANKQHVVTFAISGTEQYYNLVIVNVEGISNIGANDSTSSITIKDARDIRYCNSLTTVGSSNFFANGIIGSLSDISTSPVLTQVYGGNGYLGGTIESIVENQWGTGRRTGTIYLTQIGNKGNNVTFHDVLITSNKSYKLSISDQSVSVMDHDNNDTVIATYNGSSWTYV